MVACGGPRRGAATASWRAVTPRGAFAVLSAVFSHLASVAEAAALEFVPRNYSGEGNNLEFPQWGAVGTTQIRSVVGAEYDVDGSTPTIGSPTAREVMTDVFLTSTAGLSAKSSLFIAWGQLLTYDLALTVANGTESLDVPCNDADQNGGIDVWCPLGAASEDIPFSRSDAAEGTDGVRSPINYASSYIDLDFVYGRSTEEAELLRTMEDGFMNVTDSGVPFQNEDGTWLMADQRPAQYPVTFALHIMLLLEHNRCCVEVAPDMGFEGDEDVFQACRGWTIAIFQHVTQNDFLIRLLGITLTDLGLTPYLGSDVSDFTSLSDSEDASRRSRRGRRLYVSTDDYNTTINAAADVFTVTAGGAAFESALPGTVRIVSDGYVSTDDDNVELNVASADMAGIFARNDVADVLRGAVLSPALTVDAYYSPVVSNLSPLFKLPVDGVQRGRDHGLPSYNGAREAFGLDPATTFEDVSDDADLASRLSDAYGGDIDGLDAFTGALAEGTDSSTGGVLGDLLVAAWSDQLTRSIAGDRFYHLHARYMENVANTTLMDVIGRATNATDLPLSVFQAPSITVCDGGCAGDGDGIAVLSDNFELEWEELEDDQMAITFRCKDLGTSGWMGVGWGGLTMELAQDYILCEITDESTASCTDRSYTTEREAPPLDSAGETSLNFTDLSMEDGWTSITFLRDRGAFDDQDYDLGSDIDRAVDTLMIFAYREGEGIGQHPNGNRGAATVNFATGNVEAECDDDDFVLLHGALMLVAWMVLAPMGIYYVRYRKGERVKWAGFEWFEMHQEIMIVASEAVLPLGITAVFASGGDHTTEHAHWGYYMIAAVAVQLLTGFMRVKALEAEGANFSFLHRFNKHFHIWAGRFAYLAGVVQCYRGLELVSSDDNLVLSAGDGLELEIGSFGVFRDVGFPIWFALVGFGFLVLETRKQYRRYFRKGAANLCGCVELINEEYTGEKGDDGEEVEDRLVPRTEALPLYTVEEFNDKVLHGQSWVLVDGAVLDVSEFSHRHPGGARLILNALGTDVTQELLGEDLSVGHAMSFSPQKHPESAWEIVRSLVVGYIEEEEEEEEGDEGEEEEKNKSVRKAGAAGEETQAAAAGKETNRAFRIAGKAVLMQARGTAGRGQSTFDLETKATKANELAVVPDGPSAPSAGAGVTTFGVPVVSPGAGPAALKRTWSSKKLLQRFHVCPLLFREKMGTDSPSGRGLLFTKRPTYRYVFSCPGQAQALVEAIHGVCHFNMRGQVPGKGVIQRAYNAYAVRVQGLVDAKDGSGKGATPPRVVPAQETSEGVLCIEMRIRLYHDGAMSQLLEKLSKDTDNPAIQLQGPFIITKLVPPPAHRNVVMIAAGTGVNPMVQQIRDYLALPRDQAHSTRSRLCLIWQSMSEAELYGSEEITEMQAKSKGLLEVIVLVSGDQRRRNVPGAAFRRGKKMMSKAMAMVSPVSSSPSSSVVAMPAGRPPKVYDMSPNRPDDEERSSGGIAGHKRGRRRSDQKPLAANPWEKFQDVKFGAHPKHLPSGRMKESKSPLRKHPPPSMRSDNSDLGDGLLRGKVTREILQKAFGPALLALLEEFAKREQSRHSSSSKKTGGGEEKRDEGSSEDAGGITLDDLAGTDTVGGKLQVVVSGPSGFVFYVETILAEMGVPSEAIVFLD